MGIYDKDSKGNLRCFKTQENGKLFDKWCWNLKLVCRKNKSPDSQKLINPKQTPNKK